MEKKTSSPTCATLVYCNIPFLFFEDNCLQVIQIIILLVVDYDYEALWM